MVTRLSLANTWIECSLGWSKDEQVTWAGIVAELEKHPEFSPYITDPQTKYYLFQRRKASGNYEPCIWNWNNSVSDQMLADMLEGRSGLPPVINAQSVIFVVPPHLTTHSHDVPVVELVFEGETPLLWFPHKTKFGSYREQLEADLALAEATARFDFSIPKLSSSARFFTAESTASSRCQEVRYQDLDAYLSLAFAYEPRDGSSSPLLRLHVRSQESVESDNLLGDILEEKGSTFDPSTIVRSADAQLEQSKTEEKRARVQDKMVERNWSHNKKKQQQQEEKADKAKDQENSAWQAELARREERKKRVAPQTKWIFTPKKETAGAGDPRSKDSKSPDVKMEKKESKYPVVSSPTPGKKNHFGLGMSDNFHPEQHQTTRNAVARENGLDERDTGTVSTNTLIIVAVVLGVVLVAAVIVMGIFISRKRKCAAALKECEKPAPAVVSAPAAAPTVQTVQTVPAVETPVEAAPNVPTEPPTLQVEQQAEDQSSGPHYSQASPSYSGPISSPYYQQVIGNQGTNYYNTQHDSNAQWSQDQFTSVLGSTSDPTSNYLWAAPNQYTNGYGSQALWA